MSVVLSMEEVGPCRQKLEIAVPKAAVDAETLRVLDSYRKGVNIAGFRKGKAPKALVRRQHADDIRQEVLDRMVPRYWKQAEAEKEIDALTPPQLESVDYDLDGEMKFVAIVEVRPEIALGDIDQFHFPVVVTEPTEEEIETEVNSLRNRFGDWKVVDRAAAQGDLVKIHIRKGDAETEDPLTIEVGEARVWEEISLAVSGLSAGQQSSFDRVEGEDGEKVPYSVRIETVEEKVLPELTDAWVEEFTHLKTVEELRDRIASAARARLDEAAQRTRREAVLDQLRERHPVTVPEGVVHEEIERSMRRYAEHLARQGVDVETAEIDWPDMAERFRPQAEKVVQGDLILDAIAAERKIEVPAEKLESVLAEIAAARKTSTLAVRRALASEGRLDNLRRDLRRDEVIATLIGSKSKGTDATDGPEAAKPAKKSSAKTTKKATSEKASTKKAAAKEPAAKKASAATEDAEPKKAAKKAPSKKAMKATKPAKAGAEKDD
ncbi:MAG: trigger factor [Thermoanaerobaculia bacterium]|nr:trigger factor [Thermoanaerobaculia bacterium]